jgi:hypothetical protein
MHKLMSTVTSYNLFYKQRGKTPSDGRNYQDVTNNPGIFVREATH